MKIQDPLVQRLYFDDYWILNKQFHFLLVWTLQVVAPNNQRNIDKQEVHDHLGDETEVQKPSEQQDRNDAE